MLKSFLRVVLKFLFRVDLLGDASAFINQRTLIVANHESFIDALLLGVLLPLDAVFVVHTQIVRRPFFAFIPEMLPVNVAGGAMALINSFGALGSFVGAFLVGLLNSYTGLVLPLLASATVQVTFSGSAASPPFLSTPMAENWIWLLGV